MPELAPGLHSKYSLYVDSNEFFTVPNLSVSREEHPRVTFGCWVRPFSWPGEILGQREGGTIHRGLHIGLDNVPFLTIDDNGDRLLEMSAGLESGRWYMVAASFDAISGDMALYVDGDMLQRSMDDASLLTSAIKDDNNSGDGLFVVGSGGFVGQVDDVFVNAGVLSLGELNAIRFAADKGRPFATLLPPPSAGPAGYALQLQEGTYFDAGVLHECVLENGRMSTSVWLKPDSIGMDDVHRYSDGDMLLFELDYVLESSWGHREVRLRNGNVFVVVDSRSHDETLVMNQYPCSFPMVASEWSNLCIQWDVSSAAVEIVFAGQRCGGEEVLPTFPLGVSAQSLSLTVGRGYTGLLDELQVWCGNSSTDTSASCFNHPNDILSGRELGLAAYWSFDEGRGTICQDMANKGKMGKGLGIVSFTENYYSLNSDPRASTQYIADLYHWSASSAPISHVVNALDNAPVKLPITGKDASYRHLTARLISGPSHRSLYHISEDDADVWFPASERTPLVVGSHFPLDEGRAGGTYYVWEEDYTSADLLMFPVLDYVVYTIVTEDGSSSSYESPHSITLSIEVRQSLPRELPMFMTWGNEAEVTPTISFSGFEVRDVDAWEEPQLLHAAVSLSSDHASNKSQVSLASQQGLNFEYAGKEPDMSGFGSDLRFTGTLESISTALNEVTVALPNGTRGQGELGFAVSDDEDVSGTWLTVPMQEIVEFRYKFGSVPINTQLRPWSAPLEGGSMVTLKVSNADWGSIEDIGYSCIFGGDVYTTVFEFTLGEIKCPNSIFSEWSSRTSQSKIIHWNLGIKCS